MSKVFDCTRANRKTKSADKVGSITFNAKNDRAELYFYGDIVSSTWESYYFEEDKCPQDIADFLADLDSFQEIDVYINSGGGSVDGGMAIYSILKRHPGKKVAHVDGLAASIASVIMFACDKVIVPSNSQIMIHKPWTCTMGNADDMRKCAETLDSCQAAITAAYMQHVQEGITEEQITEMINAEKWMTGTEASKYFDIVVEEGIKVAASCKSEYFDRYRHTPEALLHPPEESDKPDETQEMLDRLQLELQLLTL